MNSTVDHSPRLPQSGWYLDEEWANFLEMEPKTFRRNCRKCGVPFRVFGNLFLVKAEDLYQHSNGTDSEDD